MPQNGQVYKSVCGWFYVKQRTAVDKNTKVRSFKSNEHICKKADGPSFEVSANKASSVTL